MKIMNEKEKSKNFSLFSVLLSVSSSSSFSSSFSSVFLFFPSILL